VEAEIGRQQLARDRLDAAGVLAEHQRRRELMHSSLDGLRAAKAFAEAGQSFVGLDLDPDQVRPLVDADRAQGRDAGHSRSSCNVLLGFMPAP
jgi:hypothetical protein